MFAQLAQTVTDYSNTTLLYSDPTMTTNTTSNSAFWAFMAVYWVVWLIVAIIMIASMWVIFRKAGRPGWAAIIPIYNSLQYIWTTGSPWWWIILLMIPIVNIVVAIVLAYKLSKAFGHGGWFTVLLVLVPVVGYPILAWGSSKYMLPKPKTGM